MNHLPDLKLNKGLLFTAYALLAISAALSIHMFVSPNIDYPLGMVAVDVVSIVVSFLYFAKGYKKDAAKYFKLAFLFEASTYILDYLYLAVSPIALVNEPATYITIAISVIMYGNTLLVAVAKDLGKKASFFIYGSNTVLYLVNLLLSINIDIASQISSIIWLSLSIVGLIMIEAKYIDKENRNLD